MKKTVAAVLRRKIARTVGEDVGHIDITDVILCRHIPDGCIESGKIIVIQTPFAAVF